MDTDALIILELNMLRSAEEEIIKLNVVCTVRVPAGGHLLSCPSEEKQEKIIHCRDVTALMNHY